MEVLQFMLELHSMSGGNTESQVSMYDVGNSLGLDRSAASSLAQELIIDELAELKTLSGAVSITPKGLELLRSEGLIAGTSVEIARLGQGPVLNEQDRQVLAALLTEIRSSALAAGSRYSQLEEVVVDLKTLDTQLLSPLPKTKIAQAILESLANALQKLDSRQIADKIGMLLRR